VKSKFQLSSFVATLMPFYVFIAFAIFSLPGGLLDAWIGKEKVHLLGLGLTTLAVGVSAIKNPTQHRRSLFGPMKVCRR
jgi:fucose permease